MVAQVERGERAGLDAELHLGDVGADVVCRAGALPVGHGTEREAAGIDQRDVEAVVGRLELEWDVAARAVDVDQRADVEFVRTRIAGIDLRAERDAGPAGRLLLVLSGGRQSQESGDGAGDQRGAAAEWRVAQNRDSLLGALAARSRRSTNYP
jgi:hypothetical protein